jgi:hypothetical protein
MLANTNGASRSQTTGRLIAVAVALCGGAVAMAEACIPDLPPDQTAPSLVADRGTCGDGYIDLDAGEQCDPGVPDASTPGCSDHCKVLCSGLKWFLNDHCYELMSASAGELQGGASNTCSRFRGQGHVVTFAGERERVEVTRYLVDAGAGPFWVGLWEGPDKFNSVNPYEPGWSPTCPGCFAHTQDAKAALPRSPEAIADPSALACVEAKPDADKDPWLQYPCTKAAGLRVVCEHEPDGVHSTPCDGGTCIDLVATYASKSYVYESAPQTWTGADAHCRSLGGTLVVLQSRDEREQLWLELSRLRVSPVIQRIWIGLAPAPASADDPDASIWIWSDGTNANAPDGYPSPWGAGEPSRSAPAFLSHSASQPAVDDTLARTDPTPQTLPYVCQFLKTAK